jgi:hypothetical protein
MERRERQEDGRDGEETDHVAIVATAAVLSLTGTLSGCRPPLALTRQARVP